MITAFLALVAGALLVPGRTALAAHEGDCASAFGTGRYNVIIGAGTINASFGSDIVCGRGGGDRISGGSGNDTFANCET